MNKKLLNKPALAMLQPPPLPGTYTYTGKTIDEIVKDCLSEAKMILENNFDGIILQNMNDMPIKQHSNFQTVAYMTRIAQEIKNAYPSLLLGILVNWDGEAALAVADACGADFIRVEHLYTGANVTSAGILQAQCVDILELKRKIGSKVPIFADIYEVHGVPIGKKSWGDAAWEAVHEAFADGLFVSGKTIEENISIVNEIKQRVYDVAAHDDADVVITEIGGTVGDIESLPFLEAIRQVKKEVSKHDVLYIHVTLIPFISAAGELKTKPTQHSVKELRSIGIQPDILVCRTEQELSKDMKEKLALFCDVDADAVIQNMTASTIYEVPLMMQKEGLDKIVLEKLEMDYRPAHMEEWERMVHRIKNPANKVKIAVVGKYVELPDAYISVTEALHHAGIYNSTDVKIKWVNAEEIEKEGTDLSDVFAGCKGILVPGGFGDRGVEGKISAIKYARENKIPFLGLCLGMQCSVIEFARHVCGMEDAHSSEFNPETNHPVIALMSSQINVEDKGGTMRLGSYPCKVTPGTKTYEAYGSELIHERHRHRFEFNNEFKQELTDAGLVIAGVCPDNGLVEIVEVKDHPWFVASQFHPELKSRPNNPQPLFRDFVKAALAVGK